MTSSERDSPRGIGETRRGFLALVAAGVVACGGGGGSQRVTLPPPSEKTVIGPGDVFTLEIVGEKDLPREFQVASDGTADLPYVQTVEQKMKCPHRPANARTSLCACCGV